MSHASDLDWVIFQGKAASKVYRWHSGVKVFKPITGVTLNAPPVRLAVVGHGVPDGWPVRVTGLKGPTQLNDKDYDAKVVDADTIDLININGAGLPAYAGGGWLEYYTPVDLAGRTARCKARTADLATVLFELTTENSGIALDNTKKTITLQHTSDQSAALSFDAGVFDIETVLAGIVESPFEGIDELPRVRLLKESTK
jgi:hypothetical protein